MPIHKMLILTIDADWLMIDDKFSKDGTKIKKVMIALDLIFEI